VSGEHPSARLAAALPLHTHSGVLRGGTEERLRGWWVLGPGGAVLLSALVMPVGFAPRYEELYVRDGAGLWLLPELLSWHAVEAPEVAWEEWTELDCDLLPGGHCWTMSSGCLAAGDALRAWAGRGYDDEALGAYLRALYVGEWGAPADGSAVGDDVEDGHPS
jgi:hypothetical protein